MLSSQAGSAGPAVFERGGNDDKSATSAEFVINAYELREVARTHHAKPSVQNTGDTDSTWLGSGVPVTALNWDRRHFTRCGWCYADDTRCLWEQEWSSYSHFETSRYSRWEYECPSCGLFTHSRCSHTS